MGIALAPEASALSRCQQPQMLAGLMAGDVAGFGQLADRNVLLQQHLHHPQAMRVSQRLEALRRLAERFEAGLRIFLRAVLMACYSNISSYHDISISKKLSFDTITSPDI